jgi:hypothetical protein
MILKILSNNQKPTQDPLKGLLSIFRVFINYNRFREALQASDLEE